jgi:hypothetical protein
MTHTTGGLCAWTIHRGTVTVPDPERAGTKMEQGDLKTDNAVQRDV